MKRYWAIFKISFQQEFAYKVNFIMWRVRNVFQIFLIFFLWDAVFSDPSKVVFGYDREKILTYVFGVIIIRALVLSARAIDVSEDIAMGKLSNYLLKPISYFRYWFTRDLSSKVLNLSFAAGEFGLLFLLLKPPIFFQTNLMILSLFLLTVLIAILIYFNLLFLVSTIPFWAPELGWGGHFLVTFVMMETLSGIIFPINILPFGLQSIILATPFPYLVFFPIQVYLGNITGAALAGGILISLAWAGVLWVAMNFVWSKGLKAYDSVGR